MRPFIGGYWLGPSINARDAASRKASGPSSSGKPWPRLIAPCSTASADMTVKIVVPRSAKTGFPRGIGTLSQGRGRHFNTDSHNRSLRRGEIVLIWQPCHQIELWKDVPHAP